MNITARRNAFGRQRESFEADLMVQGLGSQPFRAVFIRAPLIEAVGRDVVPLAMVPDGRVVAAQQGRLLATAFHPELTSDDRFHRMFVDL